MKRIFVIGSINTDLVIHAPYIPKSGETLTGSGFFLAHGGKGANQAVAAARLGGEVVMCGCVGDDGFGKDSLAALKREGIDVSHVRTVLNTATGTAMITVVGGDNRIILDRGANACLTKEDINQTLQFAKAGDIYLTQLENPIGVIGYGLKRASEKGMYVILNPAPADREIEPYLGYCNLITPNESETELFGGRDELLKKAEKLLITLGGKGYAIADKGGCNSYPCIDITVVDTTAAGDTLCGGMAAALSEGETIENAARFGSVAASLACTKRGAQTSIPFKTEVLKLI